MQDLRVALVQIDQYWENKEANFQKYERFFESIDEVDLILLPEMFQTAFTMNAAQMAEKMESSESLDWLKKMAISYNCAIYTSFIVEEIGKFYNRGVFVYPNGELAIYDKRKRFGMAGEDKVFNQGSMPTVVEYKGWKFMLQICYDLRFPEIVRNSIAINGEPNYDCILYVANWPERRIEHWKALLKARAIENQSFVLGVNRIGKDELGLSYSGDSELIDPLGNILLDAKSQENIFQGKISRETLEEIRLNLPFLKDV